LTQKRNSQKRPVVVLYDVDPSWSSEEQSEVRSLTSQISSALQNEGHLTSEAEVRDHNIKGVVSPFSPDEHVIFNWCESLPGVPRSEPLVAQELSSLGFTHTGADFEALDLAHYKMKMKSALISNNIPTPEGKIFNIPDSEGWNIFPAIVKAANEHCSTGLSRESVVMNKTELEKRLEWFFNTYSQEALVEEFIDGREFHVSLWGNGKINMLPPVEMGFSNLSDIHDRLCTYESKFVPGSKLYDSIETLLPTIDGNEQFNELERVCRLAYKAVGCRDYGRIDVRVKDGIHYVLDVNPNADISADASLAYAASQVGYSYSQTISRIVQLASKRF
jgi:D-alanine-D-alanine ligase